MDAAILFLGKRDIRTLSSLYKQKEAYGKLYAYLINWNTGALIFWVPDLLPFDGVSSQRVFPKFGKFCFWVLDKEKPCQRLKNKYQKSTAENLPTG